ncbi:hemerythrin domain-containing protein [Pedobacter sp. B4-66]|uniref:hemerythrin domain-containing protein n=1 Tax=Pedobacter sp. B4-66 TaxID=2817280 RepID=UPI001BD9C728|nr:hemerythrin domain-containing protein [Pedobacter sp. B4-66]
MEEIRFNLFKSAHKGLRALLADTLLQLQQTDFLIEAQAEAAIERIKLVLLLMHRHIKWEDDVVFPKLGAEAQSMIGYFTSQHYHTDALTLDLDILICGFEEAKANTEKEAVANNLLTAFVEFMAYKLNHMNTEEQLINPLLWCSYSDRELQALQLLHLDQSTSKSEHVFLQWMLIHNTNRELAGWLNSMKQKSTSTHFNLVYALAQEVLAPERLESINLNVYANDN